MEILQQFFIELASLFGYKYDDSFFCYLKSISVPNTTTCGKEIKRGDGGWKCKDCELETFSIYCNECFIKEKHLGHKIFFNPGAHGFCDCGVNLVLKPEGFCPKHKGDYNNMNDLMNFIKLSINEKLLNDINDIFNKIILLFINKIKLLIEKDEEEEEDEEKDNELYKMLDELEIFGNKLYNNNLGLFYLFTLKFTENFPYDTNHKCFKYDENKNLLTFIKKDDEKKHTCICPFMQVMIYTLMKRKTKQDSSSFFNLFIQTYKNKIITSLCFLNCFSEMFFNDNLKYFRGMGFQLVGEKISIILYKEQNIPFFEECFLDIYLVCDFFLIHKYYEKMQSIYIRFYQILKYLPCKTVIDQMNSNKNMMKIIIDICCLPNNVNEFQNKIKFEKFQYDGFEHNLLIVELYSLLTIISLIHIIDFDDVDLMNFIFNVIFEKINKFRKYKDNLNDKKFSPHLITIKCYSILLNRYCFNYSIKNDCDLFDSFNHFLILFPQAKELNIFIFKELINFFGFIISQMYSFFIYYGDNMISYHITYFKMKFISIKCDITLMKYLLCQPEIKEQFNIQNISLLSDIDSSNKFFNDLINEVINIKDIESITKEEVNNLKYINSLIEFLYLIIRDNLSMENIAFMNTNFKLKMKDDVYEKLYENEKDTIHNLVKNDIIHFILGKNNLVKRDDCIDYLDQTFDKNHLDLLDDILKNNCEKIVLANSLMEFSLKNEMLNLCDIDYIIPSKRRINAIKYLTNFQTKIYNISNIRLIASLDIEKKFIKNVYQTFYNEKTIDKLIKLYNLVCINKEKGKILGEIFYSNLTKIISFAFKLCSTDLLDEDFKINLSEQMKQIKDNQFQIGNTNNEKSIKSLKDKLKKKFGEKNDLLKEKIQSSSLIIEEEIEKEQEYCVYCHQTISKDYNKFENYGKIYYYFSDYLTDLLKKVPEEKRNKARKFVGCNHKIHFKCFNDYIIIHFDNEFECPLCKKLSNIILFDFSFVIEHHYELIKGINYTNNKIYMENFYKKSEEYKFQGLIQNNISLFENYCSKIFKKQILIKDINEDNSLLENIWKLISEDFEEFTMYYTRTNNKKEQIEIWKNILYNIRLLFQYKIINISDKIFKEMENILMINNINIFEELLIDNNFNGIINKYIMTSFILFDSNEENKEKIKNIFKNNISLYFIYITFIKSGSDSMELFIKYNKHDIKKALDLFLLKYKICLLLFNEKEENIDSNLFSNEIISLIKSNEDFISLINSANKDKYITQIKKQYMGIPEFNIINLPDNGIEFLNNINGSCSYCQKKNLHSYLCLLCGKKMCDNKHCYIENGSKRGKEYSFIYHSIKCCGGNGLFLDTSDAEIIYILKRRFFNSKIFIYLNNFGDVLKDKYLKDEYKLNKEELKKGINKFIDLSYRKKGFKIYFHDN